MEYLCLQKLPCLAVDSGALSQQVQHRGQTLLQLVSLEKRSQKRATCQSHFSGLFSSISLACGRHHEYRVARKQMDTEAIPASATGVSVLHHSSNPSGFPSPALQHSSARNSRAELLAQRSAAVKFGGLLE